MKRRQEEPDARCSAFFGKRPTSRTGGRRVGVELSFGTSGALVSVQSSCALRIAIENDRSGLNCRCQYGADVGWLEVVWLTKRVLIDGGGTQPSAGQRWLSVRLERFR